MGPWRWTLENSGIGFWLPSKVFPFPPSTTQLFEKCRVFTQDVPELGESASNHV